jgi:transposase
MMQRGTPPKTERNENVVKFALREMKLKAAAQEFNLSIQTTSTIVKSVINKKIHDERIQYLSPKQALIEYHDQLTEILN